MPALFSGKRALQRRTALTDFHVLSHGVIQRPQTGLAFFPKYVGNVKHIADQIDISTEFEQLSGDLEGLCATELQGPCQRQARWYRHGLI